MEVVHEHGLTGLKAAAPVRVALRTRSSAITKAGWRLEVDSDQGRGSIVAVEGDETLYRGEGIFLGWAQASLAEIYRELLPRPDEAVPDVPQLG